MEEEVWSRELWARAALKREEQKRSVSEIQEAGAVVVEVSRHAEEEDVSGQSAASSDHLSQLHG